MIQILSDRIRKFNPLNLLKVLFALILFYYVFQKTTWSDLRNLWDGLAIFWLVLAALFFYLQSVLMAYRYWLLIDKQIPFCDHLNLVMLQIILGTLIAPGAGIAAYIAILKKRWEIRLTTGAKSVIWARLADLAVLITMMGISITIVKNQIGSLFTVAMLLIIIASSALVGIVFLLKKQDSFHDFVQKLGSNQRFPILKHLEDWLSKHSENRENQNNASVTEIVGITVLIFLLNYFYFASLFFTFSLNPGIWALLFMLTIIQLINIIPIQFFGGLGITEITYLYLLVLFGYTELQVAPALIGIRVLTLLFTVGLSVHILLYSLFERKVNDESGKPHTAAQK